MPNKNLISAKFAAVIIHLIVLCLVVLLPNENMVAAQDKLEPEEIVAKHLESIGSAETRMPGRSRIASGNSVMTLKTGGSGQAGGGAIIASKDDSLIINSTFDSPEYPFERVSFDGKKLVVRQYNPGARSPIGEFFLTYDEIFKEGLVGGALSSAWALLHTEERKPKLKFDGTDKIDGKQVYKLKYRPRKSSDLNIKLYFDAETFRHIRTEYDRTIAAQMGAAPGTSASQRETRFKVVENFSNFVTVGGLSLPQKYTIEYSLFSGRSPLEIEWAFDLSKFEFNQPVNVEEFRNQK